MKRDWVDVEGVYCSPSSYEEYISSSVPLNRICMRACMHVYAHARLCPCPCPCCRRDFHRISNLVGFACVGCKAGPALWTIHELGTLRRRQRAVR